MAAKIITLAWGAVSIALFAFLVLGLGVLILNAFAILGAASEVALIALLGLFQ
jgi:hypothetical protein